MSRKPTRAALHRLIGADTDLFVARATLSVAQKRYGKALAEIGIADLPELCARLDAHLATIRAKARSMFDEPYPQQSEAGR